MKLKLSVIILIFKFLFYLSTRVSGDNTSRNTLYGIAVHKPNASEIITAIQNSNISQDFQIKHLQQFFTIERYPIDFVEKLNRFPTLSNKPIELSSDEIITLTSHADVTRESRILTKVKFYRKIQELQCTNYAILNLILKDVDTTLNAIAYLVYSMIAMTYNMSFAAGAWLWELHIKLLGLQDSKLDTGNFIDEHLTEITTTLKELMTSCQENNYPMREFSKTHYCSLENRRNLLKDYIDLFDTNLTPFFQPHKLPIQTEMLVLETLRGSPYWFFNIAGIDFNWSIIYDVLTVEIENITTGYTNKEWTTHPFKYTKSHEIVLDVTKARLYSFLWVHLIFFQKTDSKDHHEEFLRCLNYSITFDYIDDDAFNKVLVLLSKINEPKDEMIIETIDILSSEVNNIIKKYTRSKNQVAKIDYEYIKRNYRNNYSTFLADHRESLLRFENVNNTKLGIFKLNMISFYIKGSKTTNFVFPNKSQ